MIKKYWMIAVVVLFIGYRYFNPPPCVAQDRLVPAEDFIKMTVDAFKKHNGNITSIVNCCIVRRIDPSFMDKLFGVDGGVWVSIAYKKNQKEIDASYDKHLYGWGGYNYDSCGNRRHWDIPYGLPAVYIEGDGKLPPTVPEKYGEDFVKWPK